MRFAIDGESLRLQNIESSNSPSIPDPMALQYPRGGRGRHAKQSTLPIKLISICVAMRSENLLQWLYLAARNFRPFWKAKIKLANLRPSNSIKSFILHPAAKDFDTGTMPSVGMRPKVEGSVKSRIFPFSGFPPARE
jgi:hypothetical protein